MVWVGDGDYLVCLREEKRNKMKTQGTRLDTEEVSALGVDLHIHGSMCIRVDGNPKIET